MVQSLLFFFFMKITFPKAHREKNFHKHYPPNIQTNCYGVQSTAHKQLILSVCYVHFSMTALNKKVESLNWSSAHPVHSVTFLLGGSVQEKNFMPLIWFTELFISPIN